MKKTLLGLMALVVITTSCTKEETETSIPLTTEAVMGAYTITKVEATISGIRGDMTATYFSNSGMGECSRDNITTFLTGGNYEVTEGSVSCDPSKATAGTWLIEAGVMSVDGENVEVELFSGKTLRIARAYSTGSSEKVILTYTRK